jgi:hypothetical protein
MYDKNYKQETFNFFKMMRAYYNIFISLTKFCSKSKQFACERKAEVYT